VRKKAQSVDLNHVPPSST